MKKTSRFKIMLELLLWIKSFIPVMLIAIFLGLLGHFCATYITVLASYGAVKITIFHESAQISKIITVIVLFAVLRGFLRYIEQYCNHYIAFRLLAYIRDRVFLKLRTLAPAKLDGKEKGNLVQLITTDIELLEVFFAHTISPVAIAILFSGLMIYYVSHYHIVYGMIALFAYFSIGYILPSYIHYQGQENASEFRQKSGKLSSFVLDSLKGLFELLQYNHQDKRLEQLEEQSNQLSQLDRKMKKNVAKNLGMSNFLIYFFNLIMLMTAILLYRKGMVDFKGAVIPVIVLMSSYGPVVSLANLGSSLQSTLASGERILNLLHEDPIVEDITNGKNVVFDGVNLENVSFGYQSDEKILNNFSLSATKNQIVGIVGKSGSGKSTILKLLMRFYQAQQGKIHFSNTEINHINTSSLRKMEGYMSQDTYLFHDTIFNNIRIAKLDATKTEVEDAAKKASIHDFIMQLPNGYQTVVGEVGETLSSGEKQRIGLARCFLHNASLMLLDEPTSNVDSINEAIILKSCLKEKRDRTILLVSHRQSTMKIADEVIYMNAERAS